MRSLEEFGRRLSWIGGGLFLFYMGFMCGAVLTGH